MKNILSKRQGFTLIEVIAVLLMLGILASMAIRRYIDVDVAANLSGIDAAVSELNGREALIWAQIKSSTYYDPVTGDDEIWNRMKDDPGDTYPYLGEAYRWTTLPVQTGGGLSFRESPAINLNRMASNLSHPARWSR